MKTKIIAIILAVCTLFLVSCQNKGEPTEEGFVDPKTNIEYVQVTPMGLYPVYDPEEEQEYLSVNQGNTETTYYEVWFEDPSKFLCYESEGYYFLVRAKTVEEPTVAEFAPIAAFIYNSTNTIRIDQFEANKEYIPEENRARLWQKKPTFAGLLPILS